MESNKDLTNDKLDQLILSEYPYPIATNYKRLLEEQDWEKKTRICLQVFEFGLRAIALSLISQYLTRDVEKVSDPQLNQLLLTRLSRATLGTWKDILFKALQIYQGKRSLFFMPELYNFYWDTSTSPHCPQKGIHAPFDRLVQIRNDLAHAAPTGEARWEACFEESFRLLRQILGHFTFMKDYDLIRILGEEGEAYWYDIYTGLQVVSPNQPLRTKEDLTEGWFYLSKREKRFLELHPLLVFWEKELAQAESGRMRDLAIFDRFRQTSLDYLLTVLGGRVNLTERTLLAEFIQMVYYNIEKVKMARREARKLNWWLLKEVVKKISSERIGDVRSKYRRELYLQREEIKQRFGEFLASDKTCLVLIGKSGVGKSSFFLSLMDEYEDSSEVCTLMYHGARFSAEAGVAEAMARDFELYLKLEGLTEEEGIGDILFEINRIEGIADRKVVLLIDALNENPDAKKLLRRVDALVEASPYPWLKVVISSRPEAWRTIKQRVRLAEHKYYRGEETEDLGEKMQPYSVGVEMKLFAGEEISAVYAKYQKAFGLQTDYEEIPVRVRQMLRDPLTLWLVAEIHEGGKIPQDIKVSKLIEEYVENLEQAQRLYPGDIRFLEQELMPLMIREGKYANSITDEIISMTRTTDGEGLFELIHGDELLSNGQRVNQSYANLVDSDILVETGGPRDYEITFKYERFWDYFGGKHLFALLKKVVRPAEAYRSIVQSIDEHPYMWGVLLNALSRVIDGGRSDIIVQLAGYEDRNCRDLAATVLVECAQENRQVVNEVLHSLYPIPSKRKLTGTEENQVITAVEVASKLKMCEILEDALRSKSQRLRDRAIVRSYSLWREESEVGLNILERMIGQISMMTLFRERELIESSAWLSVMMLLRHFEDSEIARSLQNLWRPVIERFLLYNPNSSRGEAIKSSFRKGILRLSINTFWRLAWDIPSRYSILNLPELQEFYRFPKWVKDKALDLTVFLDPEYSDMQLLEEELLELFSLEVQGVKLNNALLKLVIDYVLVTQGQKHLREVLALTKKLANMEFERPGDSKRGMWSMAWVYWALAFLQPEIDDQLFADYTELTWRNITQVREWRGALREQAHVGYDDYAYIFVKKYGYSQVKPLKELLEWAVNTQNPQVILDILEDLGHLASSPNWEVVLAVIEPVLGYEPSQLSDNSDRSRMAEAVRAKLIELLATVWNRNPHQTEEFLDIQRVPRSIRDQIYIKKAGQRILVDLLGGRWPHFIVGQLFSPQGLHEMMWIARTGIQAKSFNHCLLQIAQKAANIIYGGEIFRIHG